MPTNKIEIYSADGEFLKGYEDVCGHDRLRTLFNYVSEQEGWNTLLEEIGYIKGAVRGTERPDLKHIELIAQNESTAKSNIIQAFLNNGIGEIIFIGRNKEYLSIVYQNNLLILNGPLDY